MNYPTGVDASEEVSPNQREWDSRFRAMVRQATSRYEESLRPNSLDSKQKLSNLEVTNPVSNPSGYSRFPSTE